MIRKEGLPFILTLLLPLALLAWFWSWWVLLPGLLPLVFLLNFFRDPDRALPPGDGIVSPADGRVISVQPLPEGEGQPYGYFLSIFMNVFDCHVNRAPAAGRIIKYQYFPGKFMPAWDEKAPLENERNLVVLDRDGIAVQFSQVAGLLARRIRFWRQTGDQVARGERVGLIMFGSRVDLWLPRGSKIRVASGQKVKAGSTLLADVE